MNGISTLDGAVDDQVNLKHTINKFKTSAKARIQEKFFFKKNEKELTLKNAGEPLTGRQ